MSMKRTLVCAIALFSFACSKPATVEDAPPIEGASADGAATSGIRPADGVVPGPMKVSDIPKAALEAICPADTIVDGACNRCPATSSVGDSEGTLTPVLVGEGAFTEPGADELFIVAQGCSNLDEIPYDEAYIVREDGGYTLAARVEYWGKVAEPACIYPRANTGRNMIVCAEVASEGAALLAVDVVHYAITETEQGPRLEGSALMRVIESEEATCTGPEVIEQELIGLEAVDTDNDGADEVVVRFASATAVVPEAFADSCEARDGGHDFPEFANKTPLFATFALEGEAFDTTIESD